MRPPSSLRAVHQLSLGSASIAGMGLLVACSGASESSLFGAPASPSAATDASPGMASDTVDATALDGGGSTPNEAGGASSGPSDSGAGGGKDAARDAAASDAGGKALVCDDGRASGTRVSCKRPDVCCGVTVQSGPPYACKPASTCDGVPIECRAASDCTGGKVCCGTYVRQAWEKVECASSCTGPDRMVMCDPRGPIATGCAAPNRFCSESARLPGFGFCTSTP